MTVVSPSQVSSSPAAASIARGLGAHVDQQLGDDGAVGALCPAADDPSIDPHRGSGVAVAVEQRRHQVVREVPVALLSSHRGRIQRGQQTHDTARSFSSQFGVAGQHDAVLAVVELDGHRAESVSAARVRAAVHPVHQRASVSVTGP